MHLPELKKEARLRTINDLIKEGVTIEKLGPFTIVVDPALPNNSMFLINSRGEYFDMNNLKQVSTT